jgi:hypothetical protein
MSATKLSFLLTSAVIATTALAQDPTKPRLRPTAPAPAPLEEPKAAPEPNAPPFNENLGLIPEAPEPAKKPKGEALVEPTKKVDRTTAAENELAARVRLRELTTRVRQEPNVAAEWDRAQTARTDFDKRDALKNYYKLLYDRIVKLDPTLQKRVAEMRTKSLHRLTETRIDPTEPIDPTERGIRRD